MPRRPPRDLTPSEASTPTGEGSLTPTDAVPLPLPKPPSIPRPPRLPPPGVAPARPGARSDMPSDLSMTAKIERLPRRDPTPAPLPPSPGARDAERWFEQVPTNPAAQAAQPGDTTGSHKFRKSSQLGVAAAPAESSAPRSWLLIGLIAAIALTVGMILGALVFSKSSGGTKCEPCTQTTAPRP